MGGISKSEKGIGYKPQAWQAVSGARAIGTAYQNTTGRPIMVSIDVNSSTGSKLEVSVDGSAWVVVGYFTNTASANTHFNQSAVVPHGHYYRASLTGTTIYSWAELR